MGSPLYDRRRYEFDEEDLFSHSHDKEQESPSFPWWKPVWNGDSWEFRNPDGKFLDLNRLISTTFPKYRQFMLSGAKYQHAPTFFVDWAKKIVYYMSCVVYIQAESRFLESVPSGLSPKELSAYMKQFDKVVDGEVQEFFNSFKE